MIEVIGGITQLDVARLLYIIGQPSIRTPELQASFDHITKLLEQMRPGQAIKMTE